MSVHEHWLTRNRALAATGAFAIYATGQAIYTGGADQTWAVWAAVAYAVTALLILATKGSTSSPGGIYLLKPGASKWQAATLSDPSATVPGFTYAGMTGPLQGVALSGNPGLHEIWMTTDGGETWQPRPIQS